MKAMVFAAGLGTRLKPFTLEHPKALVPVGGVPMLQRVILKLKDSGVTELVVNVHHFADQIEDFLKSNDFFGLETHISDERDLLLDTGGGILKARRWLDGNEPFIVHNADILTDFDTREMVSRHVASGADVTLLTDCRSTSRYLCFDGNGMMKGWLNAKTGERLPESLVIDGLEPLAFGGVHVLSPTVFDRLERFSPEAKFSIIPFYATNCRDIKIKSFMKPVDANWVDVGKPETLAEAEKLFVKI